MILERMQEKQAVSEREPPNMACSRRRLVIICSGRG